MRLRAIVALLALTASLPCLAAPRTLVLWGMNVTEDTKGDEALVREFERRHPDIKVRVLSMGAGGMSQQKLMTSIVGNTAPDVVLQDRFAVPDWASKNAFVPLDPFIARDKGRDPLTPHKDDYYPAVWQEATFDGTTYGIPAEADNRALYWNKAIFSEKAKELRAAGLDPARPPRTWGEIEAYNAVLTEYNPDHTLKRVGFMPNYGNSWLYLYAFQNNANFISPDGRTCTLASPKAEQALKFLVDAYDALGGYATAKAFESGFLTKEFGPFFVGQVAMKIDGDWNLNQLSRYGPQLDFGVAPPPVPDDRYYRRGAFKGEKDQFITWAGGFCWVIPRGARHQDDAWEYIKFAASEEGRMIACRAQASWEKLRNRAYIPKQYGNRKVNEAIFREFRPADPKFAAALRQHIDLMPFARIRPNTLVGQLLWDEHVRALETACYHKATPREALLAGQGIVQRELDNYYSASKLPLVDFRLPAYAALGALGLASMLMFIAYQKKSLAKLARHEARWAYLFVSPWVFGFLLLTLGPMLVSLFWSFTRYGVLTDARWVGLKNYADMIDTDKANITKAFFNILYIAGIGVPLAICTGLGIALLLNTGVRGMRWYRTFFYMPSIVPGIAGAILWAWVLMPDAKKGLANAAWQATLSKWIGLPPPGWLASEQWSKHALIIMGVWGAGSGMILWLAGLKGISNTLYEAASIDGADSRQQFWKITIPQLSPVIFFSNVMGFITALQEFDKVWVMKGNDGPVGPADSLLTPVVHLFNNGFGYFRMGYASAIAWVVFAIILVITAIQFKLAPRWVQYEAEG